jgi:hypothetical protein
VTDGYRLEAKLFTSSIGKTAVSSAILSSSDFWSRQGPSAMRGFLDVQAGLIGTLVRAEREAIERGKSSS